MEPGQAMQPYYWLETMETTCPKLMAAIEADECTALSPIPRRSAKEPGSQHSDSQIRCWSMVELAKYRCESRGKPGSATRSLPQLLLNKTLQGQRD